MKYRAAIGILIVNTAIIGTLGSARAQINPNPDCRTGAEGRPTMLGVSGGNYNSVSGTSCCTGTIGALVHDKRGVDYLLGTNSVLARGSTTVAIVPRSERKSSSPGWWTPDASRIRKIESPPSADGSR